MEFFLQLVVVLLAICSAWWLIRKMVRPRAPADPADEPFAEVLSPKKLSPTGRANAVALAEPDDDDPADAYPPRVL